jgi:carbamoyltransferase
MIFIAIQSGHNATVGLSKDGEIIALISEERITRKKNYAGFPSESLKFIKSKFLNNDLSKVNKFIFVGESGQVLKFVNNKINKKITNTKEEKNKNHNKRLLNYFLYNIFPNYITSSIGKLKRKIKDKSLNINEQKDIFLKIFKLYPDLSFDLNKLEFYNHHETHALSFGFYFDKPVKDFLVFTMDGEGDNISSSVSTFRNNKLEKLSENPVECSVGYLYSQVTEYLGMKPFEHEFKVMGMAPYGKKEDVERIYSKIKHLVKLDSNGRFTSYVPSNLYKYEFSKFFLNEKFQNICGAIQKMTEIIILEWINFWIKKKCVKNIIVSGGVFMNIKACKEILDLNTVDTLFVVPSSGDESCVFGALWKANNKENIKTKKINNLYYGINFEDKAEKFVKDNNINKKYEVLKFDNYVKLNDHVSKLLSENKIIGRCSGREEWGARALGNRSIICNPSKLENIRLINSTIKERDYWMPFSPTILDIDEKKYLFNNKKFKNDFMTCLFDSTDIAQKDLVCAIHPIDFTLRPQILRENQNPIYYDLIHQFKEKTNIGAVLNTSFNLHGFPNVSSHEDAFLTFEKSNLRYLIIEKFLIMKN